MSLIIKKIVRVCKSESCGNKDSVHIVDFVPQTISKSTTFLVNLVLKMWEEEPWNTFRFERIDIGN